jgi:hypothetical protein
MEVLKVKPGMYGITLAYLDDNWVQVRAEAKRQGAVLSYHRFAEQNASLSDQSIVVLITEFKNQHAYDTRDMLFGSIRKRLPNNPSGMVRPPRQEYLYETVSPGPFLDYSNIHDGNYRLFFDHN